MTSGPGLLAELARPDRVRQSGNATAAVASGVSVSKTSGTAVAISSGSAVGDATVAVASGVSDGKVSNTGVCSLNGRLCHNLAGRQSGDNLRRECRFFSFWRQRCGRNGSWRSWRGAGYGWSLDDKRKSRARYWRGLIGFGSRGCNCRCRERRLGWQGFEHGSCSLNRRVRHDLARSLTGDGLRRECRRFRIGRQRCGRNESWRSRRGAGYGWSLDDKRKSRARYWRGQIGLCSR